MKWRLSLPTPEPSTPETAPKKNRRNDRKCIATGAALSSGDPAIRFVASPDGVLTPDLAGKLPGRGAWVSANAGAIRKAFQQKAFARALKQQVSLPEGLGEDAFIAHLSGALRQRALNALGLVRKAGGLVHGFEKLRAALKKDDIIAYIHAAGAAEDARSKLLAVIQAAAPACQVIGCFTGEELDRTLGSDNIVHLGLTRAGAGKVFLHETERLTGFLPQGGMSGTNKTPD